MRETVVATFKKAFERFKEALAYINRHSEEFKRDPVRWAKIQANFKKKFEEPLDIAWNALRKEDQERFSTMYFLNRHAGNEEIKEMQRVAGFFNGKVVKVPSPKKQ
jgi:hypothetical protein